MPDPKRSDQRSLISGSLTRRNTDDEDLRVLAAVGRMYLDALDADPDNEMLTLPEAFLVTQVREAVERHERADTEERVPALARVRRAPDGSTEIYQDSGQALTVPHGIWTTVIRP